MTTNQFTGIIPSRARAACQDRPNSRHFFLTLATITRPGRGNYPAAVEDLIKMGGELSNGDGDWRYTLEMERQSRIRSY